MLKQKQIIVIRKDLNMRKGKMVAQGAHASMGAIFKDAEIVRENGKIIQKVEISENTLSWFSEKFTKICVSCDSELELLELQKKAEGANLLNFLVKDAGLTEFGGVPTYTALAIGPDSSEKIDAITAHLKLL